MKWLLLFFPLGLFAQRDIVYSPQDSMYLVPIERAQILELKARSYEELVPIVDSLVNYGETTAREAQKLADELYQLQLDFAAETELHGYVIAEYRKKCNKPNFFEKIGRAVVKGAAQFLFRILEYDKGR